MTNTDFARRCAQIAKRSSEWTFDTLTMGDEYLNRPPINDSVERFCQQIESLVKNLRSDAVQTGD